MLSRIRNGLCISVIAALAGCGESAAWRDWLTPEPPKPVELDLGSAVSSAVEELAENTNLGTIDAELLAPVSMPPPPERSRGSTDLTPVGATEVTADLSEEVGADGALEPLEIAAVDGAEEGEAAPIPGDVVAELDVGFTELENPRAEDGTFSLLGETVAAGKAVRIRWSPGHAFQGVDQPTPVMIVNGRQDGPVLCLTAAVHGDELNGVEIVRRVVYDTDPDKLSGTIVAVPIVNMPGFQRTSRYLPDRRDLNRFFPGSPSGSSAARIAHTFFAEVIRHCDALVDLHTGSFHRTNLPQLRADLRRDDVRNLSHGFGATVVLQSEGGPGTLRRAATDAGIPAITLEAGEPLRLQDDEVRHGVKGVQTLMTHLGMTKRRSIWGAKEPVYYTSTWVRADRGGFLFSDVKLGRRVTVGETLGVITDPITNEEASIQSPVTGRVLGMALNQVVMPGFAAFRIGIETSDSEAAEGVEDFSEHGDEELLSVTPAYADSVGEDSE